MMNPAIAAIAWVLAATVTAILPFRRQMVPGLALLIAAPIIIVWIGKVYGVWLALAGTAAFLSMFRRPLIYLTRRAMGLPVTRPDREDA